MPDRWALRFLLWYVCILFTQPQNRFYFLYPFHIADICVLGALGFHFLSGGQSGRQLLNLGPGSSLALGLMVMALLSQYVGAFQTNTAWNGFIDVTMKNSFVLILVEAMCFSAQRVWCVAATVLFSTLWWVKGGLRLSAAGATFAGDRLMGPAVSMIENPNGFAYMMCVMIPLYLYFFQQAREKWIKTAFLALALSSVFIVLRTGSRTGYLALIILGVFLLPKYGKNHKFALVVGALAIFTFSSSVGALNIQRFKSIPESIVAFLSGAVIEEGKLDQDSQSAQERRFKNRDTWALIKRYPVFGIGMNPDESKFGDEYPYATGQVHCEWLMAGKQMGFPGIILYFSMLSVLFLCGHKVQHRCREAWPAMADLGWTFKMQAVVFFVGGSFSPIPWNAPMMILVGASSALWVAVRDLNAAPSAGISQPLQA